MNKSRILAYDVASFSDSVRNTDENGYLHVDISNITKEQVAPYRGDEIPHYRELGFSPEQACRIVEYTVRGAAELLLATGAEPQTEIDKVTTPGGMTQKGLAAMEKAGFTQAVADGLHACLK